jgi:hypothetical protein
MPNTKISSTADYDPPFTVPRQLSRPFSCVPAQTKRSDIGAAMAARLADEQRLQIGQPDLIGPAVPVDLLMVRALVGRAIDRQPTAARRIGAGSDRREHQHNGYASVPVVH